MTFLARYAFAAAIALGAMAIYSATLVKKGVSVERARVEKVGKKIDAKARKARKKAESQPDVALRRWCRDCDNH